VSLVQSNAGLHSSKAARDVLLQKKIAAGRKAKLFEWG